MAVRIGQQTHTKHKKKTSQGNSNNTRHGRKGGGPNGSTVSKHYKKKNRGQGKR